MMIEEGHWRARKRRLNNIIYPYKVQTHLNALVLNRKAYGEALSEHQKWCIQHVGNSPLAWNMCLDAVGQRVGTVERKRLAAFLFTAHTDAVAFLLRFG